MWFDFDLEFSSVLNWELGSRVHCALVCGRGAACVWGSWIAIPGLGFNSRWCSTWVEGELLSEDLGTARERAVVLAGGCLVFEVTLLRVRIGCVDGFETNCSWLGNCPSSSSKLSSSLRF